MDMQLIVTGDVPANWDELVRSLNGNLFHTMSWAQYRALEPRCRPLFFRWGDANATVAIALGVETSLVTVAGRSVVTAVSFDTVPATGRVTRDFVPSLLSWGRKTRRVVECRLGSNDAAGRWSETVPRAARRWEFLAEPADEETALRRCRKGTRSAVRRARRLGLTVGSDHGNEALCAFAGLYGLSLGRLESEGKIARTSIDAALFARRLTELVYQGAGRLFVVRRDGAVVGGCFFGVHEHAAYYLYNGVETGALRDGATPAALVHAVARLSAEGYRRLNLGGVSGAAHDPMASDHGLYAFKLGLGASPVECESGTLITAPARKQALEATRWVRTRVR